MIYILLFVLSNTIFAQTIRFGQRKGAHVLSVVAVNYVIAAGATIVFWRLNNPSAVDGSLFPAILTGCIAGVIYCSLIPFILGSYHFAGVGITSTVIRAGVVIP
ncbi:MAG TPA: hypothetical protein ENL03_01700, partial [Phycisphaerae bacterium]|nr:hypothetical protein [Phycisphaerae bacterium]